MFIRKLISPITMKQNNDSVQKNDKSQKTLKTSFIALAATGVTLALVAPYTAKNGDDINPATLTITPQ